MQTIKMNNREAFELLTLVQRTIWRTEQAEQDAGTTEYYKNLKALEKTIHESCPELVSKWRNLQNLMESITTVDDVKGHARFKAAVDEFDKWLDANE